MPGVFFTFPAIEAVGLQRMSSNVYVLSACWEDVETLYELLRDARTQHIDDLATEEYYFRLERRKYTDAHE
jgi:hypothetical protein